MKPAATSDRQRERQVVAYVLQNPRAQKRARRLEPSALVGLDERDVMTAIGRAIAAGGRAEPSAIRRELHEAHEPARASELVTYVSDALELPLPTTFDLDMWIDELDALALRRAVVDTLRAAMARAVAGDIDGAVNLAANAAARVESEGSTAFRIANGRELVAATLEEVCGRFNRPAVDFGPLEAVARHLGPGDMVTVGGETGAGKSSVALWFAERWRRGVGSPMGVVSLEDRWHTWGDRFQAQWSGVTLLNTPRVALGEAMRRVDEEVQSGRIPDDGILLAEQTRTDLASVLAAMRALVAAGASALTVDYIQEVRIDPRVKRHEGIADAARAIKGEAKRLRVPLILCSQLSRPSSGTRREPTVSSLKESGDLENMSEGVVLLWRESDTQYAPSMLKVAKLKSSDLRPRLRIVRSPAGVIVDFDDASKDADDDVPPARWS